MSVRMWIAVLVATTLLWPRGTAVADDKSATTRQEGVRESFQFDPAEDVLIVPVQLGGKSYRFILDTGCSVMVFDKTLRSQLGRPVGQESVRMAVGKLDTDVYAAPPLSLGTLQVPMQWKVLCLDLTWMEEVSGFEIDGVLGNSALRDLIVRFDFDHHRMDILDPAIRDKSAWGTRIPFAYDEGGVLRILATIGNDRTVPLTVDTGMHGTTVNLSRSTFAAAVESGDIHTVRTAMLGTAARSESVQQGILSNLTIGPFRHRNVRVGARGGHGLGMPYLRRFQVTVDFPNEAIYLAKGKRYDDPEEALDRSGLHLLRKEGSIEVESVDLGSPSEQAGIRAKDRIVQIDGKPVATFRLCQILRRLKSPVGTVVHMAIQRDGKTSDVSFALKELSAADPRPK